MDGKNNILQDSNKGRKAKSINRDLLVFAFFLFLSFTFWYLNSLRKETEVELKYPVKFINPPKNRDISPDAPQKVILHLSGPGYSIVKLKLSGNRAPLVIDLSRVTYRKLQGSKQQDYFIESNSLTQNFSKQLRSEFRIQLIRPDTLFITLPVQVKKVPNKLVK